MLLPPLNNLPLQPGHRPGGGPGPDGLGEQPRRHRDQGRPEQAQRPPASAPADDGERADGDHYRGQAVDTVRQLKLLLEQAGAKVQ